MIGPITPLHNIEDARQALLQLLEATRRSVHLYTPYVDPRLYNDRQALDALRACIGRQPRLQCYFVLPEARLWRNDCPRLLALAERLTSIFHLRTLPEEEARDRPELSQGFVIADQGALLHQADPQNGVGSYQPRVSGQARELMHFFMEIWEKSIPDLNIRRLHI